MTTQKIKAKVWTPPKMPARARATTSTVPMPAHTLLPVPGVGPEDVAFDAAGVLYSGIGDGRIVRRHPGTDTFEVVTETGGRPLGVETAPDGTLVVCDAYRGLLRVDPATGRIDSLLDERQGYRAGLCNNAAVASDGTIYFSDSSQVYDLANHVWDLVDHTGTGRLVRRDPTGATEVMLDGLQFANGVALASDESFVLVAEMGAYRIRRVWLTGPRAGQDEVFVENLPGFPDNLSTGSDGRFWLALPTPRMPVLDWAHRKPGFVRRALWRLPEALVPPAPRTMWVLGLDSNGATVVDLQASGDAFHMVTGVVEHAGLLYLGSIVEPAIAVVPLPG